MGRKVLLFFSIILMSSYSLYGEEQEILFNLSRVSTRSVLPLPKASIDDEKILFISFEDTGSYTMYIKNNGDEIVFTSFLPATGDEYIYDLSTIIDGDYSITLEGPSGVYEGYFYLD